MPSTRRDRVEAVKPVRLRAYGVVNLHPVSLRFNCQLASACTLRRGQPLLLGFGPLEELAWVVGDVLAFGAPSLIRAALRISRRGHRSDVRPTI